MVGEKEGDEGLNPGTPHRRKKESAREAKKEWLEHSEENQATVLS